METVVKDIGRSVTLPIINGLSNSKLGRGHWNGSLRCCASYYPSPLDRIRTGKRERAIQLGIQQPLENSFEANQSFPRISQSFVKNLNNASENDVPKFGSSLSKFKGVELNSYCFSSGSLPSSCRKVVHNSSDFPLNNSELANIDPSYVHNLCGTAVFPSDPPVCSPLKAVVVVDAKTLKIVVVNDIACNLFKQSSESLCTKRLNELFVRFDRGPDAVAENLLENSSGQEVLISGKVLEALTSSGDVVPVSLWMRKLESSRKPCESTYLVVMEIVQRITANVSFTNGGEIIQNDLNFAKLLGYDIPENLIGLNIREVIPSIALPQLSKSDLIPKEHKRQYCTGRTKEGVPFPLRIYLEPQRESCEAKQFVNQISSKSHESSVCNQIVDKSTDKENENSLPQNSTRASDELENSIYSGCVWVFANISGMITLLPNGEIHSCNHHFANMLFGYSQKQLVGKNISFLIPSFYDDLKFLDADILPFDEVLEDDKNATCDDMLLSALMTSDDLADTLQSVHLSTASEGDCSHQLDCVDSSSDRVIESKCSAADIELNGDLLCADTSSYVEDVNGNHAQNELETNTNNNAEIVHASNSSIPKVQTGEDILVPKDEFNSPSPIFPSPPPPLNEQNEFYNSFQSRSDDFTDSSYPRILEGSYFGLGRHQDGSEIAIVYQVRMVELDDGQILFCMWVSRDPDEPAEWYKDHTSIGSLSGFSSLYDVLSLNGTNKDEHENSLNLILNKTDDTSALECVRGPYSSHYTTLQQIGKGAFGCVKLAVRNADKMLFVTKFICKSKVYKECWVNDNNLQKMVPLEVSLLMTLDHPNIVKVLDIYENENYFQMVMEKHGCGIDLFDFIDQSPSLDEPLASYIFRQIVSAVSYLHSLNILHRDIKDENIIIDKNFQIKLIDFGSAAFMSANDTFSTFCGTFEYCSPEVLNGEKYRGPELEMWSLGVTLFTLVYGENPFRDIEETIQADLNFPFPLSFDLMHLVSHMLHPDPNLRCTLRELEKNVWINESVDIQDYRFEDVVQRVEADAESMHCYLDFLNK